MKKIWIFLFFSLNLFGAKAQQKHSPKQLSLMNISAKLYRLTGEGKWDSLAEVMQPGEPLYVAYNIGAVPKVKRIDNMIGERFAQQVPIAKDLLAPQKNDSPVLRREIFLRYATKKLKFDCNVDKWIGLMGKAYADTTHHYNPLSALLSLPDNNVYNFPESEMQEMILKEKKAVKLVFPGYTFSLYLIFQKGKWYLLAVDFAECDCSA